MNLSKENAQKALDHAECIRVVNQEELNEKRSIVDFLKACVEGLPTEDQLTRLNEDQEEQQYREEYTVPLMAGYCVLCRRKELQLYGDILNEAGDKHTEACRQAGCSHPVQY